MNAEWVTALSSFATFLVISGSVLAAAIQLRHIRNNNQIIVFSELWRRMESPQFKGALQFILHELPMRLEETEFRMRLLDRWSTEGRIVTDVCNFFDRDVSAFVQNRMVDRTLACDLLYAPAVPCWDALAPVISSIRAKEGVRRWEGYEYFVMLCKCFRERNPSGTYPSRFPSLSLPPPWPEAFVDSFAMQPNV